MNQGTVLIAEDDSDLSHILATQCRLLGFEVFRSPDAMHALIGAHRLHPALIVMDLNMPGGNGLSVCEMLASDSEVSHIPVIIISGTANGEIIRRCESAGARYITKGPKLWIELAAAICQCLSSDKNNAAGGNPSRGGADPPGAEESLAKRPKIMAIDDDPDISEILKTRLSPYGVDVLRAFSGMQGYWLCLDLRPDAIISDLTMNDGDGDYILGRLRGHTLTEKTPVIILTGQDNPAVKRQLLAQGAAAYLNKPIVMGELLDALRPLVRLTDASTNC